ncbi:hypothetical protein GGI11_001551 [Coemansia sp. RSA 2049]|nr:hypothetical protein GGI11_001551 [Coemansia sp. RSA 2049]
MPIVSRFRLVSPENNNCELSISRSLPLQSTVDHRMVLLPEHPLECVSKGGVTWTIEHQIARRDRPMAEMPPHAAKPSLLTTTVTYNLLMREINGMLKSDPDQHVMVESAPASWPFLNRPMRMVGAWADETQPKYLLVGNFLVWWVSGFVCIFVHPTLVCLRWIISKRSRGRGVLLLLPEDSWKTSMLWVLWAAHYLVFFGMSRTTYLHHYLPAFYFAVILAALYVYRLGESASDVLLMAQVQTIAHILLLIIDLPSLPGHLPSFTQSLYTTIITAWFNNRSACPRIMHFILRRLWQWTRSLPGRPGQRKIVPPKSVKSYVMQMRGAQQRVYEIRQPPPMLIWAVFSGFTSFLAVLMICAIDKYGGAFKHHRLPFAIAPVGAASVLIFGVPSSPLSQPRNVVVGHTIAALTGTFMRELFLHASDSFEWMPGALSVGVSIGLMGLTNCYHPPAGATAFMAGYSSPTVRRVGWWFPLYPVLPLTLILLGLGILFNNLARVYPVFWFTAAHFAHQPENGAGPVAAEAVGRIGAPDRAAVDETATSASSSASSHGVRVADTVTHQVNDLTANEDDAERAWMHARIRALELEVGRLRREFDRNLIRQDGVQHDGPLHSQTWQPTF